MKVLITGASGFVGGHLAEFLSRKGIQIVGTYRTIRPKTKCFHRVSRCDLSTLKPILKIVAQEKLTHIFHLAGQSSPSLSWESPYQTLVDNTLSTIHLLEACRAAKIKPRILLASSAHVYGRACCSKRLLTEKTNPQPMDPYGSAKLQAESYAVQYWEQFKLPCVIVRATAHIGIRQPPVFAISNFAMQIARIEKGWQEPTIRVGNLKVKRGFVAILDMMRAYWLAIHRCAPGTPYNISAQKSFPMRRWLELLLSKTKRKIKIVQEESRLSLIEIPVLKISSSKFRHLTGWRERISPSSSFDDILNWWRQHV